MAGCCSKSSVIGNGVAAVLAAALLTAGTPAACQSNEAEAHARAMNDIAATPPQYEGPQDGAGEDARYDPVQNQISFMLHALEAQRMNAEALAELEADPRYQTYLNGGWDYFQSGEAPRPGEYCTASFWSHEGAITLTGGGSDYEGALLMFTGEAVPKPRELEEVRATLSQTGARPATVKVFVFRHNETLGNLGTIAFTVPTMEAALQGMVDDMEFAVSIGRREVFRMAWRDGTVARNRLRECVDQRAG